MSAIYKVVILLSLLSCRADSENRMDRVEYNRWVGDIHFDKSKDSKSFNLCNDETQTMQYFNDGNGIEYIGEKISILDIFNTEYNIKKKDETGLLRIRFIVNCNGQTGRFRLLGMDRSYNERKFHSSITDELLRIAKSLKDWKPKLINGEPVDYYQYLIFKLENGEILEILP